MEARAGKAGAVLLLAAMVAGGLVLWVGVPLGWLWIGSQIQGATQSLGTALTAMAIGVLISIGAMVAGLGALSRLYGRQRAARGLEDVGHFPLEVVMVLCASIAVVCFGAWFFLFAGSSPIPISLSA